MSQKAVDGQSLALLGESISPLQAAHGASRWRDGKQKWIVAFPLQGPLKDSESLTVMKGSAQSRRENNRSVDFAFHV
jgi:hypothetical protein